MEIIIANILMVTIMLIFSMYIFKNVVNRINQSAKKWFLDKLQDYNYLVEEQEKKLDILRKQIEEARKELNKVKEAQNMPEDIFNTNVESVLNKMKNFKNIQKELPRRPEIVYDIPTPQYKEAFFFNNYKQLRKTFNIDSKKIIEGFLEKHKVDEDEQKYNTLLGFCNKFNSKTLYECSTLQNELQYELIKEILTEEEKKLIILNDDISNKKKFTIRTLLEKVEEQIKLLDPTIYIYIGKEEFDYEQMDPRIRTYIYKNMSEGIIIHYKGKMYDYSI